MKNFQFIFILIVFTSLSFISCNKEEDKLVEAYNKLNSVIQDGSSEEIYSLLDSKSKKYVDFMSDSLNQEYQTMKDYGESVNYPLFTSICNHSVFNGNGEKDLNQKKFFFYLKMNDVPMFSTFRKTVLIEDKIQAGIDNYVTVGLDVGDNKFITTKLNFRKEDEEYKFKLMDLLNFSEKKYHQQFKRFQKNYTGPKTDDILKVFLEEMYKPENSIDQIQYRK